MEWTIEDDFPMKFPVMLHSLTSFQFNGNIGEIASPLENGRF